MTSVLAARPPFISGFNLGNLAGSTADANARFGRASLRARQAEKLTCFDLDRTPFRWIGIGCSFNSAAEVGHVP